MIEKVRVFDMSEIVDAKMDDRQPESYMTAIVDIRPGDGEWKSAKVLEVIESNENALFMGRLPEFGDYASIQTGTYEELGMTEEERIRGSELLEQFEEYHKNAPYVAVGHIFSEEPTFSKSDEYHAYPRYEMLEEKEFTLPPEVDSLEKAQLWMAVNHPEYYMGCTISQECRSGNFCAMAVPCTEYERGMYETKENRIRYSMSEAERLANRLGIDAKEMYEGKENAMNKEGSGFLSDRERVITKEEDIAKNAPKKEAPEHHLDKNYTIVWQREDAHSFVDLKYLKDRGIEPKRDDYTPVYIGEKVRSFDEAFDRFQNTQDTPSDYEARSVSVGDIITINDNGKDKSCYVEPVGFKEIKDFTKDMYLVNGMIHDKERMTPAEIEKFENIYGADIDNSKTIGSEGLAVDRMDRDLNGNGYADRYDEELDERVR